jgi:uncharacterized protein (DUF1330 family)
MKQIINIFDIFGADLCTRSKASELIDCINTQADCLVLDFDKVTFISRSFADELYNIIESVNNQNVSYLNRNSIIEHTMQVVENGRKTERKRGIPKAEMLKFDTIDGLSSYLLNMK